MDDIATEEVTTRELLDMALTDRLIDLQTSMPGIVESFNAAANTVDVVPALNRSLPDGAGNWITSARPKLADVPVAFMHGGGFFESFPIAAGDEGTIVFCSRNIGLWRANGSQGDPGDLGMHTMDGAVFIPGVASDAKVFALADGTKYVLGKAGGPLLVGDPAAGWTLTPSVSTKQSIAIAAGLAPIGVAPGAALGAGGSASLVGGHDGAFIITISPDPTTTGPAGPVAICTLESTYVNLVPMACAANAAMQFDASAHGGGIAAFGAGNTVTVYTQAKLEAGAWSANVNVYARGWL